VRKRSFSIHLTISKNSIYYAYQAINSYIYLSSPDSQITFFAYCLDDYSFLKINDSKKFESVIKIGAERVGGSVGHALALEAAVNNFTANEMNIISDTDIMIVEKHWDIRLWHEITNNSIDLLGTQHEGIGGFISKNLKEQQYKSKPSSTWMAVAPRVNLSGLGFMPNKSNFIQIDNKQLSELYNLPIGYILFRDTGWQIPAYIEDNKISYKVLEIVKPSHSNSKILKGLSDYHDEFHLGDTPFLIHQRGSMRHRYRIDKLSVGFYNAADTYLEFPEWSLRPNLITKLMSIPMTCRIKIKMVIKKLIFK